jgi:hypothetical protein
MRIASWVAVAPIVWMLSGDVRADERRPCAASRLPANVQLPSGMAPVLQRIYERSQTFRSQCDRLADAKELQVRVRINARIRGGCRAFTVIRRVGREIQAEMHLPFGRDLTELVAHEFEHLLEQVEGVNLRRLARLEGSGVRQIEPDLFESDRAQAAGRLVAKEAAQTANAPAAD